MCLQILSITGNNASNNDGMIWYLGETLKGFPGPVRTHYCLAVGNDKGLELDETDEDEELSESNEEEIEEHKGKDMRGIQCDGGRQENSLRDYSLNSRGLIYKYRVVCA